MGFLYTKKSCQRDKTESEKGRRHPQNNATFEQVWRQWTAHLKGYLLVPNLSLVTICGRGQRPVGLLHMPPANCPYNVTQLMLPNKSILRYIYLTITPELLISMQRVACWTRHLPTYPCPWRLIFPPCLALPCIQILKFHGTSFDTTINCSPDGSRKAAKLKWF